MTSRVGPTGPLLHDYGRADIEPPNTALSIALRQVLAERWRLLSMLFVGVTVVAGVLGYLLIPRLYRADMVVATVTSTKAPTQLSGLAASFIGASSGGGLNPTPEMMTAFIQSRTVGASVGRQTGGNVGPGMLAARLDGDRGKTLAEADILLAMQRHLSAAIDRKTGLITVSAVSRDSAAARIAVQNVVATASERFAQTSRAQAAEQARGLQARVDSASLALQRAENNLVDFLSRNRVIAQFSPTSADHDRLRRAIDVAERVYLQAVADREAAESRVLEDTPVIVPVDPVPSVLFRLPRGVAQRAILAGLLVAGGMFAYFFLQRYRVLTRQQPTV